MSEHVPMLTRGKFGCSSTCWCGWEGTGLYPTPRMGARRYFGRCLCGWTSRPHFRMATCADEHATHVADLLTRDLPEMSED